MNKNLTIFLQIFIVIVGVAVLAFMLVEPNFEGRNIGATFSQIYFHDSFLILAYTASIAFFVALYQAFKILGRIRHDELLSSANAKALRTIKYSGITLLCFFLAAEAYLMIVRPGDDIAGGVFMGLLGIVGSGTITIVATRFEKLLQRII
jgi:hypothetical protein